MKLKRILAGVAAASVAVSALAVSAFADALMAVQTEDGVSCGPKNNVYVVDTTSLTDEQRASIASVDFNFTLDSDFMNGGGGYNKNGSDWTQPEGFQFSAAGANTYTMEVEDYALGEDGSDSLQVQVWWLNAKDPDNAVDGTATLDSVVAKDADGNVVLSIPEVNVEIGGTNFDEGTPTTVIPVTEPGTFAPQDGMYRIDVENPWGDHLLGDQVADLNGVGAIGIHFEVSEYADYNKPFTVTPIVNSDNWNVFRWDDEQIQGVTVTSKTVEADGDYIVWVVFDAPAVIDSNFVLALVSNIPESAKTVEAGDGVPNVQILEIGYQDAGATPGTPDNPPADEDNSSDEPTTPGGPSGNIDDTSSDDNNSSDDNGNTSVDSSDDNNGGNNVNTGVTLAVVPAVLAAGALATATIVLKKRK